MDWLFCGIAVGGQIGDPDRHPLPVFRPCLDATSSWQNWDGVIGTHRGILGRVWCDVILQKVLRSGLGGKDEDRW